MASANTSVAMGSDAATSKVDYKTPEQSYQDAMAFRTTTPIGQTTTNEEFQKKISTFIMQLNDSDLILPIAAIIVVVLLVLIIVFSKSVGKFAKLFATILAVTFVAGTVWLRKNKI